MTAFTTRPELRGTFGMVASTHWLASAAGMAVLERGGNAFDAAVAAGLRPPGRRAAPERPRRRRAGPRSPAERDEPLVLCAQGVAPAAATIDAVPRRSGSTSSRARGCSPRSCRARSTAGCALLREFGTLELARRPRASRSATRSDGYPVVPGIAATIARMAEPLPRRVADVRRALPAGARARARCSATAALAATYGRIVASRAAASREERDRRARATLLPRASSPRRSTRSRRASDGLLRPTAPGLLRRRPAGWRRRSRSRSRSTTAATRSARPGRGARGRSSSSSSRCSRASTSTRWALERRVRPHRRRVREARVRRPRGVVRRPGRSSTSRSSRLLSAAYAAERRRARSRDDASARAAPRRRPAPRRPRLADRRAARRRGADPGRRERRHRATSTSSTATATSSRRRRAAAGCRARRSSRRSACRSARARRCSGSTRACRTRSRRASGRARRSRRRSRCATASRTSRSARPAATSRTSGRCTSSSATSCFGDDLQAAIDAPSFHTDHFPISFYPREAQPRALAIEARSGPASLDELRAPRPRRRVTRPWSLGPRQRRRRASRTAC